MKRKVRIKMLPKAVYGMNVTGKINNVDGSQTNQKNFLLDNGGMPSIGVNGTLKPTDRENATLEAERDETVMTQLDQANSGGIPEFYTIGGKPHSQGGTPLNLPPDSFIFSKDKKMKITDPDILAQFGKTVPKKGKKWFTPAEISKQYDINKYRKILADPNSDFHQINTAQQMIENYNLKLGGLAMVQESMKGFEDGIPGIAMPYLEHVGIDPLTLFPQSAAPQQQSPMPVEQYGGVWSDMFQMGGGNGPEAGTIVEPMQTYPAEMFANITTHQQAIDLLKGQRQASGTASTPEQQLKLTNTAEQAYFDALKENTGLAFTHTGDESSSTWKPVQQTPQAPAPKISDKPFVPGFKYENDQLYQKRQGRVTGEEHWEASNPVMAGLYAKKYGSGDLTGRELQKQIIENPEAFASTWGQEAAKDAQIAAISLKPDNAFAYGGDVSKYQFGGGEDYTTTPSETAYTQGLVPAPEQRIRINPETGAYEVVDANGVIVGKVSTPKTSSNSTKSQNVPKNAVKWDMTRKDYDETAVEPGDYVKKADGSWYKVTGYKKGTTAFTGDVDPALGSLGESYGRLEQRITESPELQKAMVKKYRENMDKAKPRNNLSEVDLEKARNLSDEEIVNNFLRAQKQVMAVQSKGPLQDKNDVWDKDLSHYRNTISELGFEPMEAWETAAFQGAYIGLQNLADNPKYKDQLEDFNISGQTQLGKADEPGGGTGRAAISDIDGWFGNTTIGQAALYAPQAKELEMQQAEWNEAKQDPVVKHLENTYQEGRTPFWTQDIINEAFALKNLWGIRKFPPWNAMPGTRLPNATFMSPDQQIQNILGATRQGTQGAAAFSNPQAYAANIASLQGNAMQQVANAIGNVQDRNVQVANQFELQRSQIMNRANEKRAQLATNLHDKNTILNQQFQNSKNKAWDEVRQGMVNMWTNRGKTQTMNELRDDFNVDPVTGYTYKSSGYRPIIPKDAQPYDLAARTNALVSAIPGITPDKAAAIAMRERAGQTSPTGFSGLDPTELGPGYPGGAPSGYQ